MVHLSVHSTRQPKSHDRWGRSLAAPLVGLARAPTILVQPLSAFAEIQVARLVNAIDQMQRVEYRELMLITYPKASFPVIYTLG